MRKITAHVLTPLPSREGPGEGETWRRRSLAHSPSVRGLQLALVLITAGLTGCGYSNQSLYRESVKTIYVDMFESKEFRRNIEFQLTESVCKQIERATPYKIAPKNRADTVLEGEVVEWRETTYGRDPITDQSIQHIGTLAIRYRWKDLRTGKLLVDRPLTVTTSDYVKLLGEQNYDAYELAVNQMARKIVESMEMPW